MQEQKPPSISYLKASLLFYGAIFASFIPGAIIFLNYHGMPLLQTHGHIVDQNNDYGECRLRVYAPDVGELAERYRRPCTRKWASGEAVIFTYKVGRLWRSPLLFDADHRIQKAN